MAPKKQQFDEKTLTKGQVRKLNALKRTLGDEQIATDAFAKWLAKAPATNGHASDPMAEKIAAALQSLRDKEKLSIPRGGYVVRSGRGRVIVEPAASEQ
jgi:hypothetical protein